MYCSDQKFSIYFKRQPSKPSLLVVQMIGRPPALSLGSLCHVSPSLWVFCDQRPVTCTFSPYRGPEIRSTWTWASGEGLRSSRGATGLASTSAILLSCFLGCQVEAAFLLITQPGRYHPLERGRHATEGRLLICSC